MLVLGQFSPTFYVKVGPRHSMGTFLRVYILTMIPIDSIHKCFCSTVMLIAEHPLLCIGQPRYIGYAYIYKLKVNTCKCIFNKYNAYFTQITVGNI